MVQLDRIFHYFKDLDEGQSEKIKALYPIYEEWNSKVNVISRKDIDQFYERHVLHSLSLAKIHDFSKDSKVIDIGTGGGFPGIPLAIIYPDCEFLLVDSIRKKINLVADVVTQLDLKNVETKWSRAEEIPDKFDVVITRAVARVHKLITWSKHHSKHLLALKGGDLTDELKEVSYLGKKIKIHPVNQYFSEPFFETKVIVEVKR